MRNDDVIVTSVKMPFTEKEKHVISVLRKDNRAVATFEATEAAASVVFRTVASVNFKQSNCTFDCHNCCNL